MTDDYTYGELIVDRIELTVRSLAADPPRPRQLTLDLTQADQSDPEIAALLEYVRRKNREQIAAARPPDGWSLGPIG